MIEYILAFAFQSPENFLVAVGMLHGLAVFLPPIFRPSKMPARNPRSKMAKRKTKKRKGVAKRRENIREAKSQSASPLQEKTSRKEMSTLSAAEQVLINQYFMSRDRKV